MKLATFRYNDTLSIGKVVGEQVIDIGLAAPDLPKDMVEFLAAGEAALAKVRALDVDSNPQACRALSDVLLEAPVQRPRKFLAAAGGYLAHQAEVARKNPNFQQPKSPVFMNKQVTCIQAPYGPVDSTSVSEELDYEVELVVVIGTRCRGVKKEDAHKVIAGYCVGNDVTVRDWQVPTMTVSKSFDTHGPIGPWITTPDEAKVEDGLWLRTYVNGDLRQDGTTKDMALPIAAQIEYLSTAFTLEPGDLIATGTPAGVGKLMDPPCFLREGDVVRCEIENLGHIENVLTRLS